MGRRSLLCLLIALSIRPLLAQNRSPDQVQVSPPPLRRAEPPSPTASLTELERRGDALRAEKSYLDALDYYRAALAQEPSNARLLNKIGITELQMGRFPEARKDFERAVKNDRQFADAVNNLGVIFYLQKRYGKAIRRYEDAIKLRPNLTLQAGVRHEFTTGWNEVSGRAANYITDAQGLLLTTPRIGSSAYTENNAKRLFGLAVLLITHNLALVNSIAVNVLVLQHGHVRERGRTEDVIGSPKHTYTRELISAVPDLGSDP